MTESEIEAVGQPAVSQIPINDLVRVLRGKKLKYTNRILFRNGTEIEFQSKDTLSVKFDEEVRTELLGSFGFKEPHVFIPWAEVLVFRQEENEV